MSSGEHDNPMPQPGEYVWPDDFSIDSHVLNGPNYNIGFRFLRANGRKREVMRMNTYGVLLYLRERSIPEADVLADRIAELEVDPASPLSHMDIVHAQLTFLSARAEDPDEKKEVTRLADVSKMVALAVHARYANLTGNTEESTVFLKELTETISKFRGSNTFDAFQELIEDLNPN